MMALVDHELVTLQRAASLFEGITPRALRRYIQAGRLAASKPGRALLVRLDDVRELFAPQLCAPVKRSKTEGETARIARQLAAAGIGD